MELPQSDVRFVRRRSTLVAAWPWVGAALILVVVALWGYLLATDALIASPWAVVARLDQGTLPASTLQVLAVLGSVAFLTVGVLMLALVLLMWAAVVNERRLLRIIGTLRRG